MAFSCLALGHILFPILLGTSYCYFVLMLCEWLQLEIVLLSTFAVLFLVYIAATRKLITSDAGFVPREDIPEHRLETLKKNSINRQQLLELMEKNVAYQQLWQLHKQFLSLYSVSSYCSLCDNIKPPRAQHCPECNRCVKRREKHNQIIGGCIGEANMKIFMQYLCIAMIMSAFCIGSVLFITISEHPKLDDLSNLELIIFAIIEMTMGTCLVLFIKEFSISYYNSTENITETQRKMKIINEKNNPFSTENYHSSLFQTKFDYLNIRNSAVQLQWTDL